MLQGQSFCPLFTFQSHGLCTLPQPSLRATESLTHYKFLDFRWLDTISYPFLPPLYAAVRHPTPPRLPPPLPPLTPRPRLTTRTLSQSSQADIVLLRQFWTAPKRMKASTSNAAIRGSDWRWHTTTINDCKVPAKEAESSEIYRRGRCEREGQRSLEDNGSD